MSGRWAHGFRRATVLLAVLVCASTFTSSQFEVHAATAAQAASNPPAPTLIDAPAASMPLEFPWRAWRLFSSNDLLPQNTVYAIAQDRTGYVYAGLGIGLARYDGDTWQRIALPGVSAPRAIGALALGTDGTLWIASDGAGVFRLVDGQARAVRGLSGPAGVVYSLLPERDGSVWASTDGGLASCRNEQCQLLPALRGIPVRTVLRAEGPDGPRLWIGTGGRGLRRLDLRNGEWVLSSFALTKDDGLPNNYVSNLLLWGGVRTASSIGRDLWIGTGRGLARYDGSHLVRYTPTNGFPGSVTSLLAGRGADSGKLFVGLHPGGLGVIAEDGSWGLLAQAQGLPDSAVQGLAYTDLGSSMPLLWVGTVAGGIARADPARWQLLDDRRGVPSRGMAGLGVARFPDGVRSLWMGSTQGTLRLGVAGWVPAWPGIPVDTAVADMVGTADDSLWVAGQRGLWRLHAADRTEFTVDNSELPAVYADLLTVEPDGQGNDTLWIGSGHGLARWTAKDGLHKVLDHPWLRDGQSIRALTLAGVGAAPPTIWVGTDSGLLEHAPSGWQQTAANCLHGASITSLAAHQGAHGGELWIGTDGPLLRLRASGCERRDDPFPGGYVEQIGFDRDGRAYVFGTGGALQLDSTRNAPFAQLPLMRYERADGLLARDYLSGRGVATDARGRIWVASTGALQVFDPASQMASGAPAALVWATHDAGRDAKPIAAGSSLPAGTTPLVFGARLLAFGREEHIQYRYQLLGLNAAPQPWISDNNVVFNRLAPGRYEFRIWARDANGVVSGPLQFGFRLLSPLWLRPWALALYALALILLGAALSRWRARALHERARRLGVEVATRTSELADANRLLDEMARTDSLTGLHNRRHAAVALPVMASHCEERHRAGGRGELLIVLIDVDHFKRINDTHGHSAGDIVLQAVASRLRHGVRDSDMLVRWGGEEFLLALNDCDPTLAATRLRALLAAVSDQPVSTGEQALRISVSAGAAAYLAPMDPTSQSSAVAVEQAIARADAALYEAKSRGRDRAVLVVDAAEAAVGGAHWPEYERVASMDVQPG